MTEKIQEHELIKTNQAEKSVQDVLDNCIERVQNNSLKSDRVTSFETPFALLFIFATIAVMLTYGVIGSAQDIYLWEPWFRFDLPLSIT